MMALKYEKHDERRVVWILMYVRTGINWKINYQFIDDYSRSWNNYKQLLTIDDQLLTIDYNY